MKNVISTLFLYVACAITIGHSIVAHHHAMIDNVQVSSLANVGLVARTTQEDLLYSFVHTVENEHELPGHSDDFGLEKSELGFDFLLPQFNPCLVSLDYFIDHFTCEFEKPLATSDCGVLSLRGPPIDLI